VQVLGIPSTDLSENMIAEEKARVLKQAEELGEKGLKRKAEELEDAIANNEVCVERISAETNYSLIH